MERMVAAVTFLWAKRTRTQTRAHFRITVGCPIQEHLGTGNLYSSYLRTAIMTTV